MKAIVVSGYSNDPVMANHEQYGFKACIKKPFALPELAEAVGSLVKDRARHRR